MALGAEIVDFIWSQLVEQFHHLRGVGQIAVMQKQTGSVDVGIGVKMVDAACVECRCAPDDAMNFVAFFQQKFRQIRSVLSSDTSDERFFHVMQSSRSFRLVLVKKRK